MCTFTRLLQECIATKDLGQGRTLHGRILRSRSRGDILLLNLLMQMYSKCGSICEAVEIFQSMEQRNVFSWNIMVSAYAQNGQLQFAKRVFDSAPVKDVVSWNVIIAAYTKDGFGREAILLLALMDLEGYRADRFTFINAFEACSLLGDLQQGKRIHMMVSQSGLELDVVVGTAVVTMYGKCGSVQDAMLAFEKMPHKNIVSWNAVLTANAQNGHLHGAVLVFEKMLVKDVYSWTAMVTAYGEAGNVSESKALFDSMPQKSIVSWNAMISVYTQNGYMQEARFLFEKMTQRDTASWNSIISGYALYGESEAIHMFRLMDIAGLETNRITFISVLNSCSTCSDLLVGRAIHDHVIVHGLVDVAVETAIVNMYGKCGEVGVAREIFDKMHARTTITWNAMLAAYAQHGHGAEGLYLFHKMNLEGVNSDTITFRSVLTACSHIGNVEQGGNYFVEMVHSHCITPAFEHYMCTVDLLARAGQIEEARDFIENVPFEPNLVSWTMLLGVNAPVGKLETV